MVSLNIPAAAVAPRSFRIRLDPAATTLLPVGLPVLAGEPDECVFPSARLIGRVGTFTLLEAGPWLLGTAASPVEPTYAGITTRLYTELLEAVGERHLCRIWNYVPDINAAGADGMENYRSFSIGRSLAFERRFGSNFSTFLPAGSAVGSEGGHLVVVFAANSLPPRHWENPEQVPAYEYPAAHGPRPPSFSRATAVSDGKRLDVFVSGTAAIKGHETVGLGDTRRQLAHTLDNLRSIFAVAGLGGDLRGGCADARHFKIYLRRADDLPIVAGMLAKELLRPDDHVSYLRADLCRAELEIEIEATILGAVSSSAGT
jgi:enamine deaminase RidA (YjgF/YER057c/UK114 family)